MSYPDETYRNRTDGTRATPAVYDIDWTNPEGVDSNELAAFVDGEYDAGKQRRSGWEQDAMLCEAYAEGDQHLRWDPTLGGLSDQIRHVAQLENGETDIPFEERFPQSINTIGGFVSHRIALLLGRPTTLYAVAQSGDDDDQASARVNTKLLQHLWYTGPDSVRSRIVRALWDMFVTGIVWINVTWDPFSGAVQKFKPKSKQADRYRADVEELSDSSTDPHVNPDGELCLPDGRVRWDFRTGYDITEPQFARTADDLEWLIDTRWRTVEYVRHRYGEPAKDITPDEDSSEDLSRWREMYPSREGEEAYVGRSDLVAVHTFWRPTRPWAPYGFMGVVCQGKTLAKRKHPYPHGEIPHVPMYATPSRFIRPRSMVYNLLGMQSARNRMRAQACAHIHLTAAPKYGAEESVYNNISKDAFDSQDRFIKLPDGSLSQNRLQPIRMPAFPGQILAVDEMIRRDMHDVAGVHPSTTGAGESKSQSGRHAALLAQGDARSGLIAREFVEDAIARAGGQTLWLYWKYTTSDRQIAVTGSGMTSEVLNFKGEDIYDEKRRGRPPGPHDFNVRVMMGAGDQIPAILDEIETMTKLRYWNPENPADRMRVAAMINKSNMVDADQDATHRQRAEGEHRLMMDKKDVAVAVGDNDDLHVHHHDLWTTTDEYRRALADDHELDHRMAIHRSAHLYNAALKKHRAEQVDAHARELVIGELSLARERQAQDGNQPPAVAGEPAGQVPVDIPAAGALNGAPPMAPPGGDMGAPIGAGELLAV